MKGEDWFQLAEEIAQFLVLANNILKNPFSWKEINVWWVWTITDFWWRSLYSTVLFKLPSSLVRRSGLTSRQQWKSARLDQSPSSFREETALAETTLLSVATIITWQRAGMWGQVTPLKFFRTKWRRLYQINPPIPWNQLIIVTGFWKVFSIHSQTRSAVFTIDGHCLGYCLRPFYQVPWQSTEMSNKKWEQNCGKAWHISHFLSDLLVSDKSAISGHFACWCYVSRKYL